MMNNLLSVTPDTSFRERIERLLDGLGFAIESRHPAIFIVSYKSRLVFKEAQRMLSSGLNELGQAIETVWMNDETNWDLALNLSMKREQDKTIYYIEGVHLVDPSAIRTLNFRREYFRDFSLRTVFWVTETEQQLLIEQAPDFWAFRTLTLSFPEIPPDYQLVPDVFEADDFVWLDLDLASLTPNIDESIAWRENDVQRVNLLEAKVFEYQHAYTLAALYWLAKNYGRAEDYATQAREIALRFHDLEREFAALIGKLNIMCATLASEQWETATTYLELAKQLHPKHEAVSLVEGNLNRLTGHYTFAEKIYLEGLEIFQERGLDPWHMQLNPFWQAIQTGLAKTYLAQGRDQEAVERLSDVIGANPTNSLAQYLYDVAQRNLGWRIELEHVESEPHLTASLPMAEEWNLHPLEVG